MTTITFDTLAYVKTLRDAGIEERQAEAQATALATVLKTGAAELATGRDIEALRASIKQDTDRLESRLNLLEERTEGRFKLLQWMLAFNLAISVALLWILYGGPHRQDKNHQSLSEGFISRRRPAARCPGGRLRFPVMVPTPAPQGDQIYQ